MNKRINDLIIKGNIYKNETTDVNKSQRLSKEMEGKRITATDEMEGKRITATDETEEKIIATTDGTEVERDNSTKINKSVRRISKPFRVSIKGKILND